MSVLIKGMSMPTSCANCEWSMLCKMDLGMSCYCQLVKKTEDIDIARKGRMSVCPLVEVEERTGLTWENGKQVEVQMLFAKEKDE